MNNHAPIGKLISILYRYGRSYLDQQMSSYDIGSGQYAFLYFLYENNGASQETISKSLQMDKTTTTRAIKKLESEGWVRRTKDESDGRMNRIYLTEKGHSMEKELKYFSGQWSDVLMHGLTPEEVNTLQILIQKLVCNATTQKNDTKNEVKHETQ